MTGSSVLTAIEGPIAHVSINRPERLNGIDIGVMEGLVAAARRIAADRSVRVVILQGEGSSFCSGLDVEAVMGNTRKMLAMFFPPPWRSTNKGQHGAWVWRDLPVPVIAVTRGHVLGGGVGFALACDFRFTTPDCTWGILESRWGLVPDGSGTIPLLEVMPPDLAKRLVLTGETFDGEKAVEYGLATGVSDDPLKQALELAERIIERSPDAVAAGKKLLNRNGRGSVRGALGRERRYQLQLMFRSANTRVAQAAAAARTTPQWKARSFR
ncbi:MAG: crotonase/enoyl-CoA hydratase family protein [Aeromicrobium sp.]